MVIDQNKKAKVVNPKSFSHGGKPKPKPILGKPNPNPQQVHLHQKDDFTPTQAMVHECLATCEIDPSDIQNVMSVFNIKKWHYITRFPMTIPSPPKVCLYQS